MYDNLYRFSLSTLRNHLENEISELSGAALKRPDLVSSYALNIERTKGQIDVLEQLETAFPEIEAWGAEQKWTPAQILTCKYAEVLDLALRHPDDTSSGRHNDGKRAYFDGRREVLMWVRTNLMHDKHFPGNNTSKEA